MSMLDETLAKGREGKQSVIKDEIYKCQQLCSTFKPTIDYKELKKKKIANQYLSKYNKCFNACVS
jgi:hypothetical protein